MNYFIVMTINDLYFRSNYKYPILYFARLLDKNHINSDFSYLRIYCYIKS